MHVWAFSLVTLLSALPAFAQEAPLPSVLELSSLCAPEVQDHRRAAVEFEGHPGLWFDREVGRCMLQRFGLLVPMAERIHLLEERLQHSDNRDALQDQETHLAVLESEHAVAALEAAERGRREAIEDRDAWYRQPGLWAVIGGVVVVVIEVVAIWVFSSLNPD